MSSVFEWIGYWAMSNEVGSTLLGLVFTWGVFLIVYSLLKIFHKPPSNIRIEIHTEGLTREEALGIVRDGISQVRTMTPEETQLLIEQGINRAARNLSVEQTPQRGLVERVGSTMWEQLGDED